MAKEEQFRFTSNHGEIKCHGVRWVPDGEVRAVLQISHGMAEHVERYREFAGYMADRGVLVVGHDHLGHGDSVKSREDYGFFAEENGNQILIADLRKVFHMTKRAYKDVPYVLLGHSMGSFLVRQYLCSYGAELDGAVICGTGYQPAIIPRLGRTICKAQARQHGWHYRSVLLRQMCFGSYNQRFVPNRTSSDWLCRDQAVVDEYEQDPRCGFDFTLNGYYNLFICLSKIIRKDYLERMPRELPVFFIAGEEDPVGDFGKGVRRVEKLFRKTGMKDVECKMYPGDRHEILNELDKGQVYEDVWSWMEKKGLIRNR